MKEQGEVIAAMLKGQGVSSPKRVRRESEILQDQIEKRKKAMLVKEIAERAQIKKLEENLRLRKEMEEREAAEKSAKERNLAAIRAIKEEQISRASTPQDQEQLHPGPKRLFSRALQL